MGRGDVLDDDDGNGGGGVDYDAEAKSAEWTMRTTHAKNTASWRSASVSREEERQGRREAQKEAMGEGKVEGLVWPKREEGGVVWGLSGRRAPRRWKARVASPERIAEKYCQECRLLPLSLGGGERRHRGGRRVVVVTMLLLPASLRCPPDDGIKEEKKKHWLAC